MTAKHEITVKFTLVQEVETVLDVTDPHEVAQYVVDQLTTCNAVASYEMLNTVLDVR